MFDKIAIEGLPGAKFGEWTVVEWKTSTGRALVVCSCGNQSFVDRYELRSGKSDRCKNCRRVLRPNGAKRPRHWSRKPAPRDQFGKWKVLEWHTEVQDSALCICIECGTEKHVRRSNLTSGASKSCTACRTAPALQKPVAEDLVCKAKMLAETYSNQQISVALGLSPQVIGSILRDPITKDRSKKTHRKPAVSVNEAEAIRNLGNQGLSERSISRMYGVCGKTISRVLRREGPYARCETRYLHPYEYTRTSGADKPDGKGWMQLETIGNSTFWRRPVKR